MLIRSILLQFIRGYQKYISSILNIFIKGNCRYIPSCSEYSYCAIKKHGALKGGAMSVKRIIKCNPLGNSGYDPVR